MNVVWIVIDALRADHCGWMGYHRPTTPRLDALAKKSLVFERAYATANMTTASMGSMLTGRYATELYRDNRHFIRYRSKNVFVGEMLSDSGVAAHAIMSHWYFRKGNATKLYEGFDQWRVVGLIKGNKSMAEVSTSPLVSEAATEELGRMPADRPWVLLLHWLDPHRSYISHRGFKPHFGKRAKERYDHEIAFTDHHIGRVLDAIAKHPAADRTAILVTSDHGESFGELGTHAHGYTMGEAELRVPGLLYVPGLEKKARRIKSPVSNVDIVPTVLGLTGASTEVKLRGRSWLDYFSPKAGRENRLIYAERPPGPHSGGKRGLLHHPWKLHWQAEGNVYRLFNLDEDPKEKSNLFHERPKVAKRMIRVLETLKKTMLKTKGRVQRR